MNRRQFVKGVLQAAAVVAAVKVGLGNLTPETVAIKPVNSYALPPTGLTGETTTHVIKNNGDFSFAIRLTDTSSVTLRPGDGCQVTRGPDGRFIEALHGHS